MPDQILFLIEQPHTQIFTHWILIFIAAWLFSSIIKLRIRSIGFDEFLIPAWSQQPGEKPVKNKKHIHPSGIISFWLFLSLLSLGMTLPQNTASLLINGNEGIRFMMTDEYLFIRNILFRGWETIAILGISMAIGTWFANTLLQYSRSDQAKEYFRKLYDTPRGKSSPHEVYFFFGSHLVYGIFLLPGLISVTELFSFDLGSAVASGMFAFAFTVMLVLLISMIGMHAYKLALSKSSETSHTPRVILSVLVILILALITNSILVALSIILLTTLIIYLTGTQNNFADNAENAVIGCFLYILRDESFETDSGVITIKEIHVKESAVKRVSDAQEHEEMIENKILFRLYAQSKEKQPSEF